MIPRLLVVDDDPAVRDVVHDYLAADGWEVAKARTGAEGLALARGGGFDIVLLDVKLPDGDGTAFCRGFKSLPGGEGIIVFMMSGQRTGTEDKIAGLERGALDYVTKPLALEELRARLNAAARALRRTRR